MSFAFMPVYTGDYLRDTQHLSCSEHGIYFKLLMHCWDQRGPAPSDERKLVGIVNARSADEIEALRRVLSEFFIRMDDGWYNRRMQREIERANALSEKRAACGQLGGRPVDNRTGKSGRKGLNDTSNLLNGIEEKPIAKQEQAIAKQVPQTPTPTLTTTTTPTPTEEFELSHFVDTFAARSEIRCPVDEIIGLWNSIVAAAGGQKALNLSKARRDMIIRRWREVAPASTSEGLAWFLSLFRDRIAASKFCTGRQPGKDGRIYRIGIDTAMRSELQLDQIAEGKYA